MRAAAIAFSLLLTGAIFAGCVQEGATLDAASATDARAFDTSRGWSMPLSPALYGVLDGVQHMVPSFDGTPISMGLFFPEIEGCDYAASVVSEECKLPVVMDAGPYWAGNVEGLSFRPPIIEWLVPRGYAVAHMSVRGTGESGGCMELFSMNEQKDVDAMITWLGEQPWSTGAVGMMGRSYDGTTPFMGAAFGNPYLKTIVPLNGVPSLRDLMFKNGTSETRGAIFHSQVYWMNYGLGAGDGGLGPGGHRMDHVQEQACEAAVQGAVQGPLATLTGDASDAYWEERDLRERVLQNYNGSIWIIHGLEDWNVNPSQVVPWFNDLQDKGIKTKMWLGVWAHAYPDRVDEHRNVRWDWADWVVKWFDSELKGLDVDTGPTVEVEDSLYVWREEMSFPPRDATWNETQLGGGAQQLAPSGRVGAFVDELTEDLRISGLPQLHVTVTPTTPVGSHIFAELYDVFPDGQQVRIGWAAMNLQYHEGGNTEPATLTPGQPILAKMEFEPMDAHVARGHRLSIAITMDGVEDLVQSPSPAPVVIDWDASVLRLPIVERGDVIPSYTPPTTGGGA